MNVLEKILEEIEEKMMLVATSKEHYSQPQDGKFVEEVITMRDVYDIIHSHMDELPDNNDGWIPVSKKLPERDYETVLCVDADDYYFVAVYTKEDGFRTEDFGADYENIIAWQPLPELYREE